MVGYLAIVYAIFTDIFVFGDSISKVELVGCATVVLITLLLGLYKARKTTESTSDTDNLLERYTAAEDFNDSNFINCAKLETFDENTSKKEKRTISRLKT